EDLRILQKDYYRDQKTGAARLTAEQLAGSIRGAEGRGARDGGRLADAEIRMSNLESEMRRLTGQLEEVRHGMARMLQRLDGLVKDVDFRLTEIEHRLSKAPGKAAKTAATTGAAGSDASLPIANAEKQNQQTEAAPATTVLPRGTPIERYNYAYSLLTKMRLQDAEAAFLEFLAQHGDDPLAGNAQYWLGETYYARQNLGEAARTFLIGIQRYPNSSKAPDSMLKLGISLSKLGKVEDACAAFLEMQRKFANLRSQVRKRMLREMKAVGCS
ncbi:MAG: tol-pal system protein YbgF, partial [Alphaproteobacteria bacterium]